MNIIRVVRLLFGLELVVLLLWLGSDQLEGALDLLGDLGGDGQVSALGPVAVLVGDPVHGVEDAVGAGVRVLTLGALGLVLAAGVLQDGLLLDLDAVLGLVAGIIPVRRNLNFVKEMLLAEKRIVETI